MNDRRRSTKAVANDELIRSSAVNEIARVGVDHLSLRDVGHVAGLTHGSAYARYEDIDELLIDVWNTTLRERLAAISRLSRNAAANPCTQTVGELFDYVRLADARDAAAIEVLLVSRRIPVLWEETTDFVRSHLELPKESSDTSARAVILFGFIMTQIVVNAQFGFDEEYQSALEKLLTEALGATTSDSFAVDLAVDHRLTPISGSDRDRFSLDTDLKSQLARATCDVVGKSGYLRATTSRIARRANCSPGAIYKFHRSKADLIIGAFEDFTASRLANAVDLARVLDEGHLVQLLNREASDESALSRNFTLEMAIAAGHSDSMRSTVWGQLIHRDFNVPDQVVTDESRDQRIRYANRMIATIIVAVGWLATLTGATAELDMRSFAEPMRRGLANQWFPDGTDS